MIFKIFEINFIIYKLLQFFWHLLLPFVVKKILFIGILKYLLEANPQIHDIIHMQILPKRNRNMHLCTLIFDFCMPILRYIH